MVTDWKLYLDSSDVTITSIWCAEESTSGTSTTIGMGGSGDMPSSVNYKIAYEINGTWYTASGTDTVN